MPFSANTPQTFNLTLINMVKSPEEKSLWDLPRQGLPTLSSALQSLSPAAPKVSVTQGSWLLLVDMVEWF